MFPILRNTILRLCSAIPRAPELFTQRPVLFHLLSKPNLIINQSIETALLSPITPVLIPNCGFKVKGRLRRRCKDCYFVLRQKRLFVICKTHPRHKQMSMIPDEENTWILTHATQGKIRPW